MKQICRAGCWRERKILLREILPHFPTLLVEEGADYTRADFPFFEGLCGEEEVQQVNRRVGRGHFLVKPLGAFATISLWNGPLTHGGGDGGGGTLTNKRGSSSSTSPLLPPPLAPGEK